MNDRELALYEEYEKCMKIYNKLALEIYKLNHNLYEPNVDKIQDLSEELGLCLDDLGIELDREER